MGRFAVAREPRAEQLADRLADRLACRGRTLRRRFGGVEGYHGGKSSMFGACSLEKRSQLGKALNLYTWDPALELDWICCFHYSDHPSCWGSFWIATHRRWWSQEGRPQELVGLLGSSVGLGLWTLSVGFFEAQS